MNFFSLLCIQPNFIPQHILNTLLQNKSFDYSQALIGCDNDQTISNYRQTKWLTLPQEIHHNLYKTIFLIHEQHLKQLYNSTVEQIEPPQFLRYDVGDHYDKHNDSEGIENGVVKRLVNRDISILLYLNDDYEGGQIEFTQLQLTIKPKAGMLLAFPSYLEFEHKVHPVTSGTRYTIVSWIATKERLYERPYDTTRKLSKTWIFDS